MSGLLYRMTMFFFRNLEIRYSMAAEARNNLVAASQNIEGVHRTLSNVEFPYCTQEEVDTLKKVWQSDKSDKQHQDIIRLVNASITPDEIKG